MTASYEDGRGGRLNWRGLRHATLAWFQPLGPRILFGLRLAASVCLALFITYYLELQNAFWAATTAAIVCQPNLGASIQKGRFRAIGSGIGAVVIVALLAICPQQREPMLLLLAVFCGACAAAATLLRNLAAYAAALAGITGAVIFADTVTDPSSAAFLAIVRVGEICIGVGAACVVALLTDRGTAGRVLSQTVSRISVKLFRGFFADVASGSVTGRGRAGRIEIARELGPLNLAIDAALGEQSLVGDRGRLRRIPMKLLDALTSWRNAAHGHDETTSMVGRGELLELLGTIDAAQLESDPAGLRRDCQAALAEIDGLRSRDAVSASLSDAAAAILRSLEASADGMLARGSLIGTGRAGWPAFPVIADPLPALVNGARTAAAVMCTAWFWVVTAWPSGPFAIVFAVIATLIFASFGDLARDLARDYTIGVTLMAVVGGVLYFGVLPAFSSFAALISVLSVLFVWLGAMQAGQWHSVVFLAMTISSLPLLGVGNPIVYDAAAYFNLALAIMAGSAVGALFFVAIPVIPPVVRARRLIALSARDLRRLMAGAWTPDRRRWTAIMARRIEVLPLQAAVEDAADLLALYAVGRAALRLEQTAPDVRTQRAVRTALKAFAEGRPFAARSMLVSWCRENRAVDAATDEARIACQSDAAVIIDAIDNHAGLLAEPLRFWQLPGTAFK
ncbi:FUSC family protein [Bradyrhizobium sp. HKCCYLR20261]|uniref:FUSC family protein n=1 Tax=Bradyrhizobium sp. HKCCYLR20261 TaxID=3420760 RepID=UPI003EBCD1EA